MTCKQYFEQFAPIRLIIYLFLIIHLFFCNWFHYFPLRVPVIFRPLYDGGEDTETLLQQTHRVRSGHDQNLRQLPLLQSQRLAFLPVC